MNEEMKQKYEKNNIILSCGFCPSLSLLVHSYLVVHRGKFVWSYTFYRHTSNYISKIHSFIISLSFIIIINFPYNFV